MFISSEFDFKLQDSRRRDNRLWLYKEYLRRVGSSVSGVYKYYEVTSLLLDLTRRRYKYPRCEMTIQDQKFRVTTAIWKEGGRYIYRVSSSLCVMDATVLKKLLVGPPHNLR
jgi:outer membrane translocation and assembly module TamA